jgi:hypothetical protein
VFVVDSDMTEPVLNYLEQISVHSSLPVAASVTIEEDFNLDKLFTDEELIKARKIYPDFGLYGRGDCVIEAPTHSLHVMDYKHGAGVPVYVKDNSQLVFYGMGALLKGASKLAKYSLEFILGSYPRIYLSVSQPRCDANKDFDTWELSSKDLLEWGFDVLRPAALATLESDAPLKTGSWCRWCPAKTSGACFPA